jgi:hypothetical protein
MKMKSSIKTGNIIFLVVWIMRILEKIKTVMIIRKGVLMKNSLSSISGRMKNDTKPARKIG